ncbi:hypothetical protein [Neptunomonas antarctica]|uniref:Cds6 C-terminal domain-containing protein n=1 Tax=Neptunomonas antarctica TaxID=619304 RepID=A0A1N7MYY6_9GAMM|nr:hypothetical protein [Neptunomonas antarctica]SIS91305.1 hypothetical protein SAMN05421760_107133 [Neptunomonas antarctica]
MTSGLVFKQRSRLLAAAATREEIAARWLIQALPCFGIAQLEGNRTAAIQKQFETEVNGCLVYWGSAETFSSYAELLADALLLPATEQAFLQHRLRRWAESDGVLWIVVDGNSLSNELLVDLVRYRPVSKDGQYAIRILLKISDNKLKDKSLKPLSDAIHERVGGADQVTKPFDLRRFCFYSVLILPTVFAGTAGYMSATSEPIFTPTVDLTSKENGSAMVSQNEVWPQSDLADIQSGLQQKSTGLQDGVKVGSDISEKTLIMALIKQWSEARQAQDVDVYLSFYDRNYSAYKHMSPDEWRLWRRARLPVPEWIRIEIGPVSVQSDKNGYWHAKFWQLYRSPGYQDDTLKELILSNVGGVWKIMDEINETVRPLSVQ